MYLLAVPTAVIMTFMFEPYERQYIFTMVSQLTMFAANSALLYQLSNKRSSYRQTSTDDAGLPHDM